MKYAAAIALTAMAMGGLHFGIEYSGWVLFVACMVALS